MKIFALILLFALSARAVEVPRSLAIGSSNFTSRALAETCYTMDALIDGMPCNPAFTAKDRESKFQAHLFFGNNVSYTKEVSNLLNENGNEQDVNRLFNQKRSSEMEANVEAGFLTENFALGYSPYRLTYYSLIRNTSLPVITLYAAQEDTLRTQVATYLRKDIFVGTQLRWVHRKFILSEFTLADALVEDANDDIFRVEEQRAFYIEPGILWAPEREWSPQVSFNITQLGFVDKKFEQLPVSPQGHLGFSVKPEISRGIFEVGTVYTMRTDYETWTELLKLGLSYQLGPTQYIASFAEKQYSLAFLFQFKPVRAGLAYDYKTFENLVGEHDNVQTLYFQVGAEI
jgi:hypothetical protein